VQRPPDKPLLFRPAPLPTAELNEAERIACLQLIRSVNVGPATFRELINHFGGARNALATLPDLARRAGSRRLIRLCPKSEAERELETAERAGAVPLFTIEPGYPALLARIEAPPADALRQGSARSAQPVCGRNRRISAVLRRRHSTRSTLCQRARRSRVRHRVGPCPRHRSRRSRGVVGARHDRGSRRRHRLDLTARAR